ncbi:MAG: hypothetical protein CBC25_02025 [Pelagibacteraceae bacterium TMED65]|nr:hypothetical protein [Rickettsiales bacterium]OUU52890.1 MAG: hypothetical protein CBC25_02025 [Pelagibacteraceae bacterium TMED65]
MKNEKSIEHLINSIYTLVNEAKKEYETIFETNNTISDRNLNKDDILLNKSVKIISEENTNFTTNESKDNDNNSIIAPKVQNNNINFKSENWENINFSSISNKNQEIYSDQINSRFIELLTKWVDKNLKIIIEREFSNYVKNIKN